MKYWCGYLTAAIFAGFTYILTQLAQKYSTLLDMVYPYVTRSVQGFLATWTGGLEVCLWQILLVLFVVAVLAALVITIIFKGSVIQWLGWVLACVSIVCFLNTGIYGLNEYNGPIEDDLRLDMTDYTRSELETAAEFYRDKANALAVQMPRDGQGNLIGSDFTELAESAGDGFHSLVMDRFFSIFGGDYTPVKALGWSGMYSSKGITGYTCTLTGEAAVNPETPAQGMPFAICREMAHRLCVARQEEASFAAFLACEANEDPQFQYSAYLMAYRSCYQALSAVDGAAAARIRMGCASELIWDLDNYNRFFSDKEEGSVPSLTAFLGLSGKESESSFCDYLVSWYLDVYAEPPEEVVKFDPFDENQVDLSGIPNARPRETEESE